MYNINIENYKYLLPDYTGLKTNIRQNLRIELNDHMFNINNHDWISYLLNIVKLQVFLEWDTKYIIKYHIKYIQKIPISTSTTLLSS